MSVVTLSLVDDTNLRGDGVTRDARLTGTAEANGTVSILNGDTVLAVVDTDESGHFTYRPSLADGRYTLTARQVLAAGPVETAQLGFTLDTVAPTLTLVRINDGANADLPVDTQTGATVINARALEGDIFLNAVSRGVETGGATPLRAVVSLSADDFYLDQMIYQTTSVVRAFPNNPVGDGVMTSVIRAGSMATSAIKEYAPDGTYHLHINVTDLAGNVAAELTRAVILDLRADGGEAAALQVNGPEGGGVARGGAAAVSFAVSGLDADASAVAHFTDGTHVTQVAVASNGRYVADLTGFSGAVTSHLAIADVHGNTADIDGNAVRALSGHTAGDFDGGGAADLLWRNDEGFFTIWHATRDGFAQNVYVDGSVGRDWTLQAQADFNGDGKADLAWRHDGGTLTLWQSTGTGFTPNTVVDSSMSPSWHVVAAQDYNGDGKTDLLWRNDDGAISVWHANETGFTHDAFVDASVTSDWRLIGSADFNGDGKADLVWRNKDSGLVTEWQSTSSGFVANVVVDGSIDKTWHLAATGDFNGDGMADLLLRHDDGAIDVRQSNGSGFAATATRTSNLGTDWAIAKVADFNGDGRDDLLWRRADGVFTEWQSTGSGFAENTFLDTSVSTAWHLAPNGFEYV